MEPTWHRRPKDGKTVLVLEVTSSLEDGPPDDFECAVLELTPEYAAGLLARIEMVKKWLEQDSQLQCAQFWNYDVEYFPLAWDESDDSDRVPDPLWDAKGEYDGRTETDMLEVGQSGYVEWRAYVKNTDIRIFTSSLSFEDLKRYVAGENPWPLSDDVAEMESRIKTTVDSFNGDNSSD